MLTKASSFAVPVALILAGCAPQDTPTAPAVAELEVRFNHAASGTARNAAAPLEGDQEVPAVDTRATGVAVFQLSKDGTSIDYRLNVANIVDVLQAHIHLGPRGVNAPVVTFLYPAAPPAALIPGRTDGTLATGTITAANLRGPLGGASLSDLWEAMRAGNAYVNVHTVANPGGEIRGQINAAGH